MPGQLRIVLSASAVGSNKRQHFDSQAAREVFPPDIEVPAGGGEVTLVLPDGSTLPVSSAHTGMFPAQQWVPSSSTATQQRWFVSSPASLPSRGSPQPCLFVKVTPRCQLSGL